MFSGQNGEQPNQQRSEEQLHTLNMSFSNLNMPSIRGYEQKKVIFICPPQDKS